MAGNLNKVREEHKAYAKAYRLAHPEIKKRGMSPLGYKHPLPSALRNPLYYMRKKNGLVFVIRLMIEEMGCLLMGHQHFRQKSSRRGGPPKEYGAIHCARCAWIWVRRV